MSHLHIGEIASQLNPDESVPKPRITEVKTFFDTELERQLALSVLEFLMMKPSKEKPLISDYNFERTICSQSLINLFAHFEALMSDTVKLICKIRPEVLRSNKKISFEDAIEFETNIKQLLIDKFAYEFGWKSNDEKLNFLKKEFGLKLDLDDSSLGSLVNAENIRHICVHNGGRINQEFINRTKNKDFEIGGFVVFSLNEIVSISKLTHYIASKIYVETVKKVFKDYKESKLDGVFLQWSDLIEELKKEEGK